jgi:hypothetical protein
MMTDRQEIRAKSVELAIQFIGFGKPFKAMTEDLAKEKVDLVMEAIRIFTNRFEALILEVSGQQHG